MFSPVTIPSPEAANPLFEQALFEQAPVAMLVLDGAGHIDQLNAAAERLFGYAKPELVGRSVEVLMPEVVRKRQKRVREDVLQLPNSRPMGEGRQLSARRTHLWSECR